MKYLLLIIPSIALLSCNTINREALIKTDSLLTVINSIDTLIAVYELDSTQERYKNMQKEVEFFGMYLMNFPENREQRDDVAEYANSAKGFKRFFNNLKTYQSNIQFSRKQIETLNADINNGTLTDEEIEKYLSEEIKAVSELHNMVSESVEKYNMLCSVYNKCKPSVILVIDSVKKANRIQ